MTKYVLILIDALSIVCEVNEKGKTMKKTLFYCKIQGNDNNSSVFCLYTFNLTLQKHENLISNQLFKVFFRNNDNMKTYQKQ